MKFFLKALVDHVSALFEQTVDAWISPKHQIKSYHYQKRLSSIELCQATSDVSREYQTSTEELRGRFFILPN